MNSLLEERGFTLTEVLIALTLTGLLLTVLAQTGQVAFTRWSRLEQEIEVQQHLNIALERMARELRQAKRLLGTSPTELSFQKVDGTSVRYYLRTGSGNLLRAESGGKPPVAGYVKRVQLAYYNAEGSPTSDPEQGTSVEITLTGGAPGIPDQTVQTKVQIRARSCL
ncbi:MAG: prepilin-type N-terminal cleavage/methylation domain-containing protein [Bacillota bacterium]|nr:prepilin-type N-terminal cleavage/methylation domain-containing protein [Bacillota bacterium]